MTDIGKPAAATRRRGRRVFTSGSKDVAGLCVSLKRRLASSPSSRGPTATRSASSVPGANFGWPEPVDRVREPARPPARRPAATPAGVRSSTSRLFVTSLDGKALLATKVVNGGLARFTVSLRGKYGRLHTVVAGRGRRAVDHDGQPRRSRARRSRSTTGCCASSRGGDARQQRLTRRARHRLAAAVGDRDRLRARAGRPARRRDVRVRRARDGAHRPRRRRRRPRHPRHDARRDRRVRDAQARRAARICTTCSATRSPGSIPTSCSPRTCAGSARCRRRPCRTRWTSSAARPRSSPSTRTRSPRCSRRSARSARTRGVPDRADALVALAAGPPRRRRGAPSPAVRGRGWRSSSGSTRRSRAGTGCPTW